MFRVKVRAGVFWWYVVCTPWSRVSRLMCCLKTDESRSYNYSRLTLPNTESGA